MGAPSAATERFSAIARELARLLGSTAIAMLLVDRDLRVLSYTASLRELLAISDRDFGAPVRTLQRHFEDNTLIADMQAVLRQRRPREAEVISQSGQAYVRLALPYRADEGGPEGVVVLFIDITRRKLAETALRTSEERHRKILDSVAEYAILLIDLKGRFVNWTTSAERILGYSADEAIGQHLHLIHPPEERDLSVIQDQMDQAQARTSTTVERWHVRKDGSRFWGTGVLSALHDEAGRLYGYVKVLRDNTERKKALDALHQAKIDAELANSAKDFFLANVSHELRTPLSVMLLWAKFLRRQKRLNPQQLTEALDAIVKSAEEQQALIEDLMDTSRIVAGKMRLEMEEFRLRALVRKTLDAVEPAALEKGLRLRAKLDPAAGLVRADPLRLQQVLSNLLNNAVKFTPEGGQVTLDLKRRGQAVEIRVRDTGQGISPEFIDKVFDRFTQQDMAAVRTNGGLGLGLSISRQLVQLHGGTITVHSEGLAKGTTFTVRLPLPIVSARPARPRSRRAPLPSLRGISILLVEDVLHTRRALAAVLTEAEAKVTAVASAPEALRCFDERRPDVLLSDIGLGKMSGHDLIAEIRQRERLLRLPALPAVALTAYADERNRHLAQQSGFQRVLTKPVEAIDLIRELSRLAAPRTSARGRP